MAFLMQVSTYFVKEAFNYDKDNVTLKAIPGLTASHLEPNGFEKDASLPSFSALVTMCCVVCTTTKAL